MSKKVYKCMMSNVNGENTGSFTRTGMTKTSPSPGILYKKNCINESYFYADPDIGGTNNYYKLINPKDYKINSSGTVYVWLSKSYLTGWSLVDDPSSIPTPTPEPTVATRTQSPIVARDLEKSDNTLDFGTATDSAVAYNANGKSINESITEYVSYTKGSIRSNYLNDYSSIITDINKIENNLNIGLNADNADAVQKDMLTKFNRFLIAFPNNELPKTFAHVFFTRPELNLYNESNKALLTKVSNDPYFYYMDKNSPDLLKSLTKDFSRDHEFNPYLSNRAESFELKDEYIETAEYGETFTGWKIKYGKHNIKSKTADSFSISYTDDNNYNVFKIHKAWTDYISKVYRGEFDVNRRSIINKTIDYASSVYYFLCGPDGETILFWSKYTGVFPTNTPSAASGWQKGNILKVPNFSINYEFSWKEDMNPASLAEFNLNSKKQSRYTYAKTYEPDLVATGKTFVNAPFVETSVNSSTNQYEYKLRFRT